MKNNDMIDAQTYQTLKDVICPAINERALLLQSALNGEMDDAQAQSIEKKSKVIKILLSEIKALQNFTESFQSPDDEGDDSELQELMRQANEEVRRFREGLDE